jgi:hypothetical protein
MIGRTTFACLLMLLSFGNGAAPGEEKEIATDDGSGVSKSSIAGSGHAVVLEAPDGKWNLTAVKIYGSRYGYPQPPAEDFRIWLCEESGKVLKTFTFPYSSFERGTAQWITLETKPTPVPKKFILIVGFNPTQTKGVYVYYDAKKDGDSRQGLPQKLKPFDKGDWLIRAVAAEAK